MKKIISTTKAPAAIGPYNQAVVYDGKVFTSGNISLDENGNMVGEGDIQLQTKQVMENLTNVLEAAGSDINCVIKTTCFLKDMNDFKSFNEVYESYFKESAPARSTVEVARLPLDVLVEVEAIAYINE